VSTSEAGRAATGRRRWRTVDGIVLLDKPQGLSSTQALQRVRRLLQAEKAGHAGTLDPMATGMLPLCFGQATKACGALLGARKAYRATVILGVATDTGDADGQVTGRREVDAFDRVQLESVLESLRGDRLQVPPMYSALKRDGRPLYELARRGETVERAARPVTIESLEVLSSSTEHALEFVVVCSKGTYVRVLGEELAAGLGTVGHLGALRRLWVEPFEAAMMYTLDQLESAVTAGAGAGDWLLPVDHAFPSLPRLDLDERQDLHLRQGRALEGGGDLAVGTLFRAYGATGGFLGLVEVDTDHTLRVRRLFVTGAGTGPDGSKT